MKYCKNCNAELKDDAKFCFLCGSKVEEGNPQTSEKAGGQPGQDAWFYVDASQNTIGPRSESQMADLIASRTLNGSSYVWKEGMGDWQMIANTPLSVYLPRSTAYQSAGEEKSFGSVSSSPAMFTAHSIPLYLLLSLVTCGLFAYFWFYSVIKETNELLAEEGRDQLTSAGKSLLFVILTCGVYQIYALYKAAKAIAGLEFNGWSVPDNSVFCGLGSAFGLSIVSFAVFQDTLNNVVKHH